MDAFSTNSNPTEMSLENSFAPETAYLSSYLRDNLETPNFLRGHYQLSRIAEEIRSSGATRIALQFSEDLLFLSAKLNAELSSILLESDNSKKYKLCIIGDTAYSECCIDDISAKHYNVEHIVHFGKSCLSEYNGSLYHSYSFGTFPSNLPQHLDTLKDALKDITQAYPDQKILILYDIYYHHEVEVFVSIFQDYENVHLCCLFNIGTTRKDTKNQIEIIQSEDNIEGINNVQFCSIYGRELPIEYDNFNAGESKSVPILFWIGNPEVKVLSNFMLYFSSSKVSSLISSNFYIQLSLSSATNYDDVMKKNDD